MALSFPNSVARDIATGVVSWVAGTYHILLVQAAFVYAATMNFRDDVTSEVSGTNYSAGGLAIDNKTASSANPTVLTADDETIAQSGSGFTDASEYVLAKILGGASSADPLFAHGLFGAAVGNVAGPLVLDVPSSWITFTV